MVCTRPGGHDDALTPLTPSETDYVQQLQDEGKRFENLQYIALGAGSVFAIASGVLFYFGYLADDGSVALGSGPRRPPPEPGARPPAPPAAAACCSCVSRAWRR